MIAQCEDISRTNNRIHQLLTNVMHNPIDKDNLNESLEELFQKVMKLKKVDISGPLMEKEEAVVPTKDDISPKEDPDWAHIQLQQKENEKLKAEAEALEESKSNDDKPSSNKRQHSNRPRTDRQKSKRKPRGFFNRKPKSEDIQEN